MFLVAWVLHGRKREVSATLEDDIDVVEFKTLNAFTFVRQKNRLPCAPHFEKVPSHPWATQASLKWSGRAFSIFVDKARFSAQMVEGSVANIPFFENRPSLLPAFPKNRPMEDIPSVFECLIKLYASGWRTRIATVAPCIYLWASPIIGSRYVLGNRW